MKLRILSFLLASILLFGCSSDSDSLTVNEQNLMGRWYRKGAKLTNRQYEEYEHLCLTSKDYQEFLPSQDLNYYEYGSNCEINFTGIRFWYLQGKELTIVDPDPAVIFDKTYTIEKLTEKELVLRIDTDTPTGTDTDKYYWTRN